LSENVVITDQGIDDAFDFAIPPSFMASLSGAALAALAGRNTPAASQAIPPRAMKQKNHQFHSSQPSQKTARIDIQVDRDDAV